jgi:hypothetical protein
MRKEADVKAKAKAKAKAKESRISLDLHKFITLYTCEPLHCIGRSWAGAVDVPVQLRPSTRDIGWKSIA